MIRDSYLFTEIHQQPDVLQGLYAHERENIRAIATDLNRRRITNVFVAARGTSDNAGRYAEYPLGAVNRLPVGLAAPSLSSIYHRPPRFQDALIIGISQSGASPDIVSVLSEARAGGAVTLAITNVPTSPLAQNADHIIPLHAGDERSIAATKTFTTQLMALALLSAGMAQDQAMLDMLERIPELMRRVLGMSDEVERAAERYRYMRVCVVIGRGYNYCTAFETALKIKELAYVLAEPYSSADFMHGPVALVEESFPTFVIAPTGALSSEMSAFIQTLKGRGAEVIAISDDETLLSASRISLHIPVSVPEWVSPLTSILPGQLFAMHLAGVRDYDVDQPRGLRKVTETR